MATASSLFDSFDRTAPGIADDSSNRQGVEAALRTVLRLSGRRYAAVTALDACGVQVLFRQALHGPLGPAQAHGEERCFVRTADGEVVDVCARSDNDDCVAVPILDREGLLLGTLSLLDEVPGSAPVDLESLLRAAALLAPRLARHPVPRI